VTAEATALPGSARPAAHRPEREAEKVSRVVEAWPAGFRRAAERRASAEVTDLQEAAADYDTGSKDAA
jgi:hypothetical protein